MILDFMDIFKANVILHIRHILMIQVFLNVFAAYVIVVSLVQYRYKPKSWQGYQRAINAFPPWSSQTPSIYIITGVILKRVTESIVPV